jgi:putative flippase GtrA
LTRTGALEVPVEQQEQERILDYPIEKRGRSGGSVCRQFLSFCLVGGLNTTIDLLVLNGLLWLWPTQNTVLLLAYNSLAYASGATNSFFWNKYWTFRSRQPTTYRELMRFTLTTLCGLVINNVLLWIASEVLHPTMINATLWANASKALAISGTFMISFLGMRLWVFVRHPSGAHATRGQDQPAYRRR